MPQTKWNGGGVIETIEVNAHKIALSKGYRINELAKMNMDPLYTSNNRWSKIHPDLKHEGRSGLARASIHVEDKRSEHRVMIGSDSETMKKGIGSITGSNTYYFGYLEFGTWAIPALGALRKAFDEVRHGK